MGNKVAVESQSITENNPLESGVFFSEDLQGNFISLYDNKCLNRIQIQIFLSYDYYH